MPANEKIERLLRSLASVAGCGTLCTDENLTPRFGERSCFFSCPAKRGIESAADAETGCAYAHRRAVYGAEKFGGSYIYFCPAGFAFCLAGYTGEKESSYLIAGPMNITAREDFVLGDSSVALNDEKIDSAAFAAFEKTVPHIDASRVSAIADLLLAVALSLTEKREGAFESEEKMRLQQTIGDYVQNIKSRMILGIDRFSPYPYEKERLLVHAIRSGDAPTAKKYLNEILGHIFFASANNLDAIKLRAFELTVVISRAALDGGADEGSIYQLSPQFITDFFALDSVDDICYALLGVLKRFSAETFGVTEAKHGSMVTQIVSFIRNNYMHKLTLADVSAHVFLSPSYLSRIFKEEMHTSFHAYLNGVRIEKSKVLLLSNDLSLTEISELVGFIDQSYFNKVFKKQTGITPKKYRETGGENRTETRDNK